MTPAPLPTWSNLLSALVHRSPSDIELAAPWRRPGEVTGWLSRSAWSLALIALWRQRNSPSSPVSVWIPDFFCNASLSALRQTGAKLVFYPLTDKMVPDISACRTLTSGSTPDVFILVHYFGQPTAAAAARNFCARHGAWLVEDAAHVLRPVDGIGVYGDFVLYSPHKHLPIPDGAVLVVRTNGPCKLGAVELEALGQPSSWAGQLRELQKRLGYSVNSGRSRAAVWFVKRMLQKMGIRSWRRSVAPFIESVNPDEAATTQLGDARLSGLSRQLLAGLLSDIETVACKRECHQKIWDEMLIDKKEPLLAAERPMHREWTPYLAAYSIGFSEAETIYDQWHRRGLPVLTWPDLPPEVIGNLKRHANAWLLRHNRLYLPVHQSLCLSENNSKIESI